MAAGQTFAPIPLASDAQVVEDWMTQLEHDNRYLAAVWAGA